MILKPAMAALLASGLVVPEKPKLVFPKPAIIKSLREDLVRDVLMGMPLTLGMIAKTRNEITFVGSQAVSNATASTPYTISTTGLSGGVDTQVRVGDFCIILTGNAGNTDNTPGVLDATFTWTEAAELYADGTTNDVNASLSYAVATTTPPSTFDINTATTSTSFSKISILYVFRGVNTSTPLDVAVTTATGTGNYVADPPAITPVTAGACVVVAGFGSMGSANTATYTAVSSGYTRMRAVNQTTAITSRALAAMGHKLLVTPGVSENPGAFTASGSNSVSGWAAFTIALRPA